MTIAQSPPPTPAADRLVLQHVVVVHRHGDRSPEFDEAGANIRVSADDQQLWTAQLASPAQLAELNTIGAVVGPTPDTQPSKPPRQGGIFPSAGHVTKRGLARMERVGETLRERYADFADPTWSNDQVFVQSTNYSRTIQSCQSLLKGFFPRSAGQDQPPFFVRVNDALCLDHPISVYDDLETRLKKDLTTKYGVAGYAELRERAYNALGVDRSLPVPWSAARDILDCNFAQGLAPPEGISDRVVADIWAVDCWMWHQLYGNLEFCRQYFRDGVRQVFELLERAAKQTNAHKLAIMAAHDNTIVALLKALRVDLPTDSVPTFGSTLCIETYIDPVTNAAFVKLDLNHQPLEMDSHAKASDATASSSKDSMAPFGEVAAIVADFFAQA